MTEPYPNVTGSNVLPTVLETARDVLFNTRYAIFQVYSYKRGPVSAYVSAPAPNSLAPRSKGFSEKCSTVFRMPFIIKPPDFPTYFIALNGIVYGAIAI